MSSKTRTMRWLVAAVLWMAVAACGEANDDSDVIIVEPPEGTTTSTAGGLLSTTTTPVSVNDGAHFGS